VGAPAGRPDYSIRDIDGAGSLIPALQRDRYFAVTFVEPAAARDYVGLDFLSEQRRRARSSAPSSPASRPPPRRCNLPAPCPAPACCCCKPCTPTTTTSRRLARC
jgi:hypothetical protein